MAENAEVPEPADTVKTASDIELTWVDTLAPPATRPYLRLSRMHGPIGTWLLYIPCLWALALAILATQSHDARDLWTVIGCGIGALLMRGAGCTWNDITDRDFDGHVERTKLRPLPAGEVTVKKALVWMVVQCLLAFGVLITFYPAAIILGILALAPVAIYPFAKRFTWWPQAFLGIAFNWGALLGWAAHTNSIGPVPLVLYAAGIAWTLFYDTIYAHQDAEDDALIGVKSTARLFGEKSRLWLRMFMTLTILLFGLAVVLACIERSALSLVIAIGGPWALGWHLTWQLTKFDPDDNDVLLRLFQSNRDAGLIPLPFFALAYLV